MRIRSYSKPTREEWRTINNELPNADVETIRKVVQSVMSEPSGMKDIMMLVMNNVKSETHNTGTMTSNNTFRRSNSNLFNFQHQYCPQLDKSSYHSGSTASSTLKRTYNDINDECYDDEDSEMSGVENYSSAHCYHQQQQQQQQQYRHHHQYHHHHRHTLQPLSSTSHRKRKSLHDRDINIPTPQSDPVNPLWTSCASSSSTTSTIPPTSKRQCQRSTTSLHISQCKNCGSTFGDQHGKMHACLYHPGSLMLGLSDKDAPLKKVIECLECHSDARFFQSLDKSRITSSAVWSCCMLDSSSAGCFVSRHVGESGWDMNDRMWKGLHGNGDIEKSEFLKLKERGVILSR